MIDIESLKVDYESIFLLLTDASKKGYVPSYYYLGSLNGKNVGGRKADCESAVTVISQIIST